MFFAFVKVLFGILLRICTRICTVLFYPSLCLRFESQGKKIKQ